LGIDPVPLKTCNFNCVYCQLGRTGRPVMRRRPFARLSRVLAELAEALESCRGNDPNWITLVGSGETTLCSGIGALIRLVKARTTLPVAVITNGSLLRSPRVRDELAAAPRSSSAGSTGRSPPSPSPTTSKGSPASGSPTGAGSGSRSCSSTG
jgi:wyosine [tRNA(Phe)-imidazoG37] synthetase (radical SAM superfamily)